MMPSVKVNGQDKKKERWWFIDEANMLCIRTL